MAALGTLSATHLRKTFPGVVALDDVSLELLGGTVHALVGANGAGKSTLIKILTGYYDSYEGLIEMDGRPVSIHSPAQAKASGIEVVHQEVDTTLVPSLSVGENLFLEKIANGESGALIRWHQVNAEAQQALAEVGLNLDVSGLVEDLSLQEKQLLVIARAISHNVRYLIFDEPTASLSLREVEKLFEIIRGLKAAGVGVIYISHRLAEVKTLADEVSVLRQGRLVANLKGDIDLSKVVEHMLGEAASYQFPPRASADAQSDEPPALEARGLNSAAVHDINLTLHRGEILGITGLVGAGKTELLRLLFGADKPGSGEICVNGEAVKLSRPEQAVNHGIFLVPEERRKHGLMVDSTAGWNITLPFLKAFSAFSWMLPRKESNYTAEIVRRVGMVPPDPEMVVNTLSGGNQQKVVIGKWIGRRPTALLFDEATQGIDIRAKHDVYELARQISRDAGVIFSSSEIDEVLGLADRVVVMRDGRVVCELTGATADRQLALEYATGTR
jgi:simple sugar transport system ATP-binding protein